MTLAEAITADDASRAQRRPWKTFHASGVGGRDCDLHVYFARTRNQDGIMWSAESQGHMDNGTWGHELLRRKLLNSGFEIMQTHNGKSNDCYWPEYDLAGVVDGWTRAQDGTVTLYEAKICSAHRFSSLNCAADLMDDWWDRKDLTQVGLYQYLTNWDGPTEIILGDRGVWKSILVTLENVTHLVSETLERITRVRAHIAAGTQPQPRVWSWDICERCDFLPLCPVEHPSLKGEVIDDLDLAILLQDRDRLMETGRLYASYDRKARELLKRYDFDLAICGEFKIKRGSQTKIERISQ